MRVHDLAKYVWPLFKEWKWELSINLFDDKLQKFIINSYCFRKKKFNK
jgi:hypothetical protein